MQALSCKAIRSFTVALCMIFVQSYAGLAFFSKTGTASFDELKLSGHARSAALGGSGRAYPLSPHEVTHTPLALTRATNYFIGGSSIALPNQIGATLNTIQLGTHLSSFNLSVAGKYLDFDNIMGRDNNGSQTAPYSAQTFHLQGTIAGDSAHYQWAGQLLYSFQALDTYSSHAFSGSFALGYSLNNQIHSAVTISNIGYASPLNEEEVTLPTTLSLSFVYLITATKVINSHTFIDFVKVNEENLYPTLGQEISFWNMLFIRSGYMFHNDQSWSAGGGLSVGQYHIDYAYQNHPEMDGYHHTSIGFNF